MTTTANKKLDAAARKLAAWHSEDVRQFIDVVRVPEGRLYTHVGWNAQVFLPSNSVADDASEWPALPGLVGVHDAGLSTTAAKAAELKALSVIAQIEAGRYPLDTAQLEWDANPANGVRITTTDGHHLASIVHRVYGAPEVAAKGKTCRHVDARGLAFLVDLLGKACAERKDVLWAPVNIDGRNGVALYAPEPGAVAVLWQPENDWPDWRQVVPKLAHKITLPLGFFDAVEVVGRTTSEASAAVVVEIGLASLEHKMASVSLRSRYVGSAFKVTADTVCHLDKMPMPKGEDWEARIGIDPRLLGNVASLLEARHPTLRPRPFCLKWTDKDTGLIVSDPDKQFKDDLYMVMPIDV